MLKSSENVNENIEDYVTQKKEKNKKEKKKKN